MLSASDLYAISQGWKNTGEYECHYCASKCGRNRIHDEPAPIPFLRNPTTSKRPGNPFFCDGCFLWKRKYTTINFIGGGFKDRQCALANSWWFTRENAFAIRPTEKNDKEALAKLIIHPPLTFCLSLLDGVGINPIQLCITNDFVKVDNNTPLKFTVNGIEHTYSVVELEDGVRSGEGIEPGVRYLMSFLGEQLSELLAIPKRGRGRPKIGEEPEVRHRRTLLASGMSGHIHTPDPFDEED